MIRLHPSSTRTCTPRPYPTLFRSSTVFQYRFRKRERSFIMKRWYFAPLGLLISILSTIIGALGPVLNPFYLNLGLDKEELIATKTAGSFFMGLSQIGSYTFFVIGGASCREGVGQ